MTSTSVSGWRMQSRVTASLTIPATSAVTACRTSDGYSDAIRRKINELGNAAWMLGDENWLHLVQRRVSYGCWDYIAVRKAGSAEVEARLPHHPVT